MTGTRGDSAQSAYGAHIAEEEKMALEFGRVKRSVERNEGSQKGVDWPSAAHHTAQSESVWQIHRIVDNEVSGDIEIRA